MLLDLKEVKNVFLQEAFPDLHYPAFGLEFSLHEPVRLTYNTTVNTSLQDSRSYLSH